MDTRSMEGIARVHWRWMTLLFVAGCALRTCSRELFCAYAPCTILFGTALLTRKRTTRLIIKPIPLSYTVPTAGLISFRRAS